MRITAYFLGALLTTALVARALMSPVPANADDFTLARAIPNDVFMYTATRHNPEREFLDEYWGEVLDALAQSGVGDDVIDMMSGLVGVGPEEEVQRLKNRASELLDGVNWEQLAGNESVFAERFTPPTQFDQNRPPMLIANMVWLLRGSGEGAAQNYEGLVAILEGIVEEINKAQGREILAVEKRTEKGAKIASVDLLQMAPGAPKLPLAVALHDDIVVIAFQENLFSDVLGLLDGSSSKMALEKDARFKNAFADLPRAEDNMTFFDMQALIKPLHSFASTLMDFVVAPRDVYQNSGMTAEVTQLNGQAMSSYQRGDAKEALALVEKAYEVAPENSIILYNLACFNALVGNNNKALDWLEKAVEGGFFAPQKIDSDSDLKSLHGEPRYRAVLSRASDLATESRAKDIVVNSSRKGEAYSLIMQADQLYQQEDYEQGLKLVEQAYAVDPKNSRVLYGLGYFHALLGHEDQALGFLEKAVEGGFFCPHHIANDPDWESLREHKRYLAALANSKSRAAKHAARESTDKLALAKGLVDRLADAMGTLDYSATVITTDGYSLRTETVTALVPDAKSKPIYPVFAKRQQVTNFDRYLPQETMSFSVSSGFDVRTLYKFIEDSFRAAGPKGEELLVKWGEIQEQIGINVQKDVVGWIDGDYVSVSLADGAGEVLMVKVTDEQIAREKIAAAIEFLSTKLSELVMKNPAMAGLAMLSVHTSPVEHEQLQGFQNLHFTMSPQPLVWGVADGYLIFASSTKAITLCQATARGEHPSIKSNARVMSEALVPDGPVVSISLTDQRKMGEDIATGLGIGSMITGMMGAMIPEPKVRPILMKISGMCVKLTPIARKINFYKSTASYTTFDGQKFYARAVTHYDSAAERAAKIQPAAEQESATTEQGAAE